MASALRERMKQQRPKRIERTMRNTPVLLSRLLPLRLGARSACVTAIIYCWLSITVRVQTDNFLWLDQDIYIRIQGAGHLNFSLGPEEREKRDIYGRVLE